MFAIAAALLLFTQPASLDGTWRATVACPGGDLPFGLEIKSTDAGVSAWLLNPPERIEIPKVSWDGKTLILDMEHYDSRIEATLRQDTGGLRGTWTKQRAKEVAKLTFDAVRGTERFPTSKPSPAADWPLRWSVMFSSAGGPAVLVLQPPVGNLVSGTFQTEVGDYRYLSGRIDGDQLQLSCFDGAHAFLFRARRHKDGNLSGDFWSGGHWHETWIAMPNANARLPDGFGLTRFRGHINLEALRFPDLDGKLRTLEDPELRGTITIVEIFGSWCPNCHDAGAFLRELMDEYGDRGLKVIGLAFELTGNFERDARQVRRYAERYKLDFPMLIGGKSDKQLASAALPVLDRVRAYPTFLFFSPHGELLEIYTGFHGPATGPEHEALTKRFREILDAYLD